MTNFLDYNWQNIYLTETFHDFYFLDILFNILFLWFNYFSRTIFALTSTQESSPADRCECFRHARWYSLRSRASWYIRTKEMAIWCMVKWCNISKLNGVWRYSRVSKFMVPKNYNNFNMLNYALNFFFFITYTPFL